MHAWLAVRHTQAVARRQSPKPKDLRYWSGMLCLGLTHRDTACLPNVQYHKMKQDQLASLTTEIHDLRANMETTTADIQERQEILKERGQTSNAANKCVPGMLSVRCCCHQK